jgi:hypothetical protein
MYQRLLTGALLLLGLSSASAGHAQAAPDPERAAVQQVITKLGEYIQAGDLSAADSLFPARGHILTDNATTHSWAEFRDQFLKPEMARYQGLRYAHTAVEPVARGNVAWVAFRRQISGTGTTPASGRGTAVLEKVDGRWLIVHLHMSQ